MITFWAPIDPGNGSSWGQNFRSTTRRCSRVRKFASI